MNAADRAAPSLAEVRRQQILDAAEQCFRERGCHNASMAEIARTFGMSAGHIYNYFDSKEAIIAAIVERDLAGFFRRAEELRAAGDLVEAIVERIEAGVADKLDRRKSALPLEVVAVAGSGDLKTLINDSINQTLSRTVLTSLLTWITVCGALFFLGGEALRGFSFVLVIGIIIGTYSSIYIAAPILVAWQEWITKRKGPEPARGGTAAPKPPARKVKAAGRA